MASGVAPNLTGLLTTSGILTRARGSDSNLDTVLKAKADLRVGASVAEPDSLIVHPANLSTIQLAKDSQGRYVTNDPAAAGPEKLFGMRLIPTTRSLRGPRSWATSPGERGCTCVCLRWLRFIPTRAAPPSSSATRSRALRGAARPRGATSHVPNNHYRAQLMPRYRVAKSREL